MYIFILFFDYSEIYYVCHFFLMAWKICGGCFEAMKSNFMEATTMSFIILIIESHFKSRSLSIGSTEVLCNRFHGAFVMTRLLLSIPNASHCDAVCEERHKSVGPISYFISIRGYKYMILTSFAFIKSY